MFGSSGTIRMKITTQFLIDNFEDLLPFLSFLYLLSVTTVHSRYLESRKLELSVSRANFSDHASSFNRNNYLLSQTLIILNNFLFPLGVRELTVYIFTVVISVIVSRKDHFYSISIVISVNSNQKSITPPPKKQKW